MKNNYYKVFAWLFVGLLVTFACGYLTASSVKLLTAIFSGSGYWVIFILEVVVAIVLGARIHKMDPTIAKILYILYAGLTGLTFSSIFIIYKMTSIIFIFLLASLLFGVFAIIGKYTNIDLGKFSTYLLMVLFAIILLEIVNIFIMNNTLDMALCIISLIIFFGYTAFDMQRISRMGEFESDNMAIYGAFQLYLDFINIFIKLLRLFGKEKD